MGVGVVGLAENIATQPSLAGAWAELGKIGKTIRFFEGGGRGHTVGQQLVPISSHGTTT